MLRISENFLISLNAKSMLRIGLAYGIAKFTVADEPVAVVSSVTSTREATWRVCARRLRTATSTGVRT
jgi:hypothetical protein